MLERVCKKTEFEVEGWRKIPPLLDILQQQNIPTDEQARMNLEIIETEAIFEKTLFDDALKNARKNPRTQDSTKLRIQDFLRNQDSAGGGTAIKDSWIYEHFKKDSTKQSKIAIYVNAVIPINEKLDVSQLNSVGNHCVVVSGLAKWPKDHPNGIECLELENNGGCDETRFIPVEFPFFEEIQIEATKIHTDNANKGIEFYNGRMNKLGKKWVDKKWGAFQKIEQDWYNRTKPTKEGQKINDESKPPSKYELLFVRGRSPCFRLEFTSN